MTLGIHLINGRLSTIRAFLCLAAILAYVGCAEKNQPLNTEAEPMTTPKTPSQLRDSILAWLDSVAEKPGQITGRWKYNRHAYRPWSAESSAMGIGILKKAGILDELTVEKKQELAAVLQSWQDPEDGYFKDPLLEEEDKTSDYHPWTHVWFHSSGTVTSALKSLDAEPLYPTPESLFQDLRKVDVEEWILGLDWKDAYQNSGIWGYGLIRYRQTQGLEEGEMDEVCRTAFRVMEEEILNPRSGLPDGRGCEDDLAAMAGLYSLLPAYLNVGRDYPYPKKAIDSVLAMQNDNGGWGRSLCMHYDALWTLDVLNTQLGHAYRLEDIQAAAEDLKNYLLREHYKPDGGFSFYPDHCMTTHMSIRISDPLPESDTTGTAMSWGCIRMADELMAMQSAKSAEMRPSGD